MDLETKREIKAVENALELLQIDREVLEGKLKMLKSPRSGAHITYGTPITREQGIEVKTLLSNVFTNLTILSRHEGDIQQDTVVLFMQFEGFRTSVLTTRIFLELKRLGYYISGLNTNQLYLSVL